MRKYLNLDYLIPVLVILIFLLGIFGCDNVSPDIRKEHIEGYKPDYFGLRWDWKW